jgi:single-stranded-DNA-specific exonuclease
MQYLSFTPGTGIRRFPGGNSNLKAVQWQIRAPAPPRDVARISLETGLPPLLAALLWSRGFTENVHASLEPPLELSAISTLQQAAERLVAATKAGKRIMIHGDYDADGISGTAVLMLGLRTLGADVTPFLPDRLTDGYGISPARVAEHAEQADLFITVDCGISNLAEIAGLQAKGVEVIVTDHHTPGPELPDCLVVHPGLAPGAGPGPGELTGAGVAYHLLWAVHRQLGLPDPLHFTDLAAIGTVADVAPLLGDNRALVRAGLEQMRDSRWPGLRASVAQAAMRGPLTARQLAFVLAPRLNAAGRLGEAGLGLELLTTSVEHRARELAIYLDARNDERRRIQDEMFARTLEQVDHEAPALVVNDEGGHPGVMGIVASKLLERFYKPVFIMAQGKGSVRSTPGISAIGALNAAAEHLQRYGGHAQAAGFSLLPAKLPLFRSAIERFVASHPVPRPLVLLDALLGNGDASASLVSSVARLEPLGEGLPEPVFGLSAPLEAARAVGRNQATLQLRLAGLKGVAWQMGQRAAGLRSGQPLDAAVRLQESEWQGRRQIEFVASDLREAGPLPVADGGPASASIRRGPPDLEGAVRVEADSDLPEAASSIWLKGLPLGSGAAGLLDPLRQLLAGTAQLYFDLDATALRAVEAASHELITVADARKGFVCLQRGKQLPWSAARNALIVTALRELELLDARGFPLRGQKREPYSSPVLLASELARWQLNTFLSAYRHYDAAGFAVAVERLFGPAS